MVRSGRHAAADNAFGRSAGNAALRGAALLAIALVLGVVLLQKTDRESAANRVSSGRTNPPAHGVTGNTTPPPEETTTSTTLAPAHAHGQVKVLSVNGTNTKGLAGKAKEKLAAAGYNALSPVSGSSTTLTATVVYFAAGYEPDAVEIVQLLGAGTVAPIATPPPVPAAQMNGANVVVVLGQDLVSLAGAPTATPTTVASTTRRTTTTVKH